ncbi:MAG: ATP-dependent Clp protease proteolytic subunit [Pseudomonadota bacterium]|nr:ATP-dependent Clp protease proteolytic subunit [Pseudomonadota bacterium]
MAKLVLPCLKTAYHISVKGYVGGYDFDRSTVDRELAKNEGKQVNVLIDSLGGSLATGLSISAAFKNHGNVNVHFVGLNASAATIICSVYTLSGITR